MQSSRSPKDTSVKLFTSEMVGAPSLSQAAGTLIGVLSACLVNGFGMQQVSSFVVTQGLGQITVPVATGWERMCVIDVAGCTDASYNGEYKLTQVSADGLRVSFPIDAPDGTVQGAAITVKLAPAGWLLRFADPATNKAVYMPGTPQWAGHCLRVEDIVGTHANVRAYESMTSVDDGLGMFPTVAQVPAATWPKAFGNSRPARWLVVADEQLAFVAPAPAYSSSVSTGAYAMRWFGLFEALQPQDLHAVSISVRSGTGGNGEFGSVWGVASINASSVQSNVFVSRSADGVAASVAMFSSTLQPADAGSGEDSACGPSSGVSVGNFVFAEKYLRQELRVYPRARMPAVLHAMHTGLANVVANGAMELVGGRVHRFFGGPGSQSASFSSQSMGVINVEGPWR